MAYTLAVKRDVFQHRGICVVDRENNWTPMISLSDKKQLTLVFVLCGQGAQWPRMGAALIEKVPSFRRDIEMMDQVLQALPEAPEWTLIGTNLSAFPLRRY